MKKSWIAVVIILVIIMGYFCGATYKCSHTENSPYYGNDGHCFAIVWIGSGQSERMYCGVITVDDYNKWCNGENGTIFIYNTTKEGYGNRISINKIISIENLGSEPDWLPLNFW